MIYFLVDSYRNIKIGFSQHVPSRIRNLQAAHPQPLYLLATESGDERYEGDLHHRFRHLQIRGEWFRAGDELIQYIAGLHPGAWKKGCSLESLQANSIIKDAQDMANQISAKGQAEAKRYIRAAQRRADFIIGQAEAKRCVQEALKRADFIIGRAERKAAQLVKSAEISRAASKQATEIIRLAQAERLHILNEAYENAEAIAEGAKTKARQLAHLRFDCHCIRCSQAKPDARIRTDENRWCDWCWNEHLTLRDIASAAQTIREAA